MDEQSIENQIKLLITSQKSLGDNIEKLYQTVTQQDERFNKLRLAMLKSMIAFFDSQSDEGTNP